MFDFIENAFESLIGLLQNASILFALTFIFGSTNLNPQSKKLLDKVLISLFIGLMAVLVIAARWELQPGVYYDTRSVLYSIVGYFFAPLITILSSLIGIAYRIIIGGNGVYAGVATIVLTSSFGISWKVFRSKLPKMPIFYEYFLFGLIASVLTLLSQVLVPNTDYLDTLAKISLPYLLIFPFFGVLIMNGLKNQKDRLETNVELTKQQILLQASIDSTKTMEIFALNPNYEYLTFNQFHIQSMRKYYQKEITKHSNYLDYIVDEDMQYRIKSFIDKALLGESFRRTIEVEVTKGKFLEELYTPIRDLDGEIIGVTIFSQEITERKEYEDSILYLSYHDPLTGLNNRRFYSEELFRLDHLEYYPLSIIMADINGLKIMNDAFGHDAGDTLLKIVSEELTSVFRGFANVSRVGGDEYVVLLKNTSKQEAMKLIDKAKKNIEKNILNGMKVSVSFGLATKERDFSTKEIIKLAEDDMYKHKLSEGSSNRNESIKTILHTLHIKNPREEQHSKRVSDYCVIIGKVLGMRDDELDLLKVIGNLHDIGKIAIDEAILNKPSSLSEEEYSVIKRHPEIGYRILSSSKEYTEFAQDILSHHERYDGKGYPQGLKGQEIPYRARIIMIADSFDAMISERPYRKPFSVKAALAEIEKNAGTQFDPMIAAKFLEYMRKQKI